MTFYDVGGDPSTFWGVFVDGVGLRDGHPVGTDVFYNRNGSFPYIISVFINSMNMKLYKIILSFVAVALLTAFTAPRKTSLERYVERVEQSCDTWTAEDWEKSKEDFEVYYARFQENIDDYTPEEKEAVYKAVGKYKGLQLKFMTSQAEGALKEFGERLPSLIEGFMSIFE